eukprot:TRINITY_DN10491_c0_g1_i1.p1 TRINITY_DN10491_c0_g1~~TRINITY_DN10491_c0_g1_i1.p1  ORF type:complete len:777 (-),score=153.84 TRINITY_DN10491_c0_g1_i1:104-2434(-)
MLVSQPSPRSPREDSLGNETGVTLKSASDSIPLNGSGASWNTNGLPSLSSESFSTGSTGYHPLYFSKDVFNSPHFSVDEFIADCRLRTPHNDLAELQKDIQSYEASLDNELIELINKDYADFVNLSAKLFGIDKTIETLRAPLDKLSKEVSGVRDAVKDAVIFLQNKLQEKRDIERKKATLQLFMNIDKTVRKIEKLLELEGDAYLFNQQRNDTKPFLLKADEETSNLIQRAANDFNQLKFYVSSGKDFLFVKNMELRISFIETLLKEGLERLFREGLLNKNIDIVANCLRTYAAINKETEAESLFRTFVVRPYFDKIVTVEKLEAGGNRGSCGGLPNIYNEIVQFVAKECTILLQLTNKAIRGFNFLVNSVWAEATSQLISKVPTIFAPGMPELFHKNYLITIDFIERMESYCHNRTELLHFRSHTAYVEFLKRWNLAIYFGIQFQNIAQKVEQALNGEEQAISVDSPAPAYDFALPATKQIWTYIWLCWDSNIFLPPLVDRFLGLSLQIIARYKSWIEFGLQLMNPEQQNPTDASAEDKARTWATHLTFDHLIFLLNDSRQLINKINTFYPILQQRGCLAKVNEQVHPLISESCAECAASIEELSQKIINLMTQITVKKSIESLQSLRGITATYRMTNKPTPTRPSIYVADILKALNALTSLQAKVSLTKEETQKWNSTILASITEKFVEMSTDLINTITHQSEVLKRVIKKAQTSSSGMSDNDKILLQLYLDVREFGEELKRFGIDTSSFAPYNQLLASVKEGEKIYLSINQQ